ncbi:MAG: hypothetical protein OXG68_07905 [Chloroflexi bacterium]|nr:hypothetical protein [Chloroflexota bacterium]
MIDPATLAAIGSLLGVGLELVHQGHKVHELTNTKKKRINRKKRRNDGNVFVIQEVEYSRKFKVGSALGNDDWLTRQNAKVPGRVEAVLVVPTADIQELERELHKFCATHRNVGDWFDLTPTQVTELRQLQVVVDLAAGSLVRAGVELNDDELERATRLFELLTNASKSSEHHQVTDSASGPSANLELKSVPTVSYQSLPKLRRRSGYLLVIRDVEQNLHRIEKTAYPVQYIGDALGLVNPRFGLELVLALESERVRQVEEALSTLYPADNEFGWRKLSKPQLQEIRNLAGHRPVAKTVYVTPKTHWRLEAVQTADHYDLPRLRHPAGYVCITQGVKPGKKYKIWHTTKPKDLAEDLRFALMLNNPYDATTSSEPIRYACVVRTEHASSFQDFLHKRYSEFRQGGDWFDLDEAHLKEITRIARGR